MLPMSDYTLGRRKACTSELKRHLVSQPDQSDYTTTVMNETFELSENVGRASVSQSQW